MKFGDYVANLNKFLKDNPESKDFETITSKDDEGNGFNRVYYNPSTGHYDENDGEFDQGQDDEDQKQTHNAVCVN